MMTARRPTHRIALAALAAALVLLAASVTACDGGEDWIPDPSQPSPVDLSTPEAAVRSYLEHVTFSYRMADSELSTQTMTPNEGVRVDSYIELNRENGQGIEQRLERFDVRSQSEEPTRAVLSAEEEWSYRYFGLSSNRYTSPRYQASYETTYTLVRTERGWLVEKVDAHALTEVR